jgi:hypothetical protein
VITSQNTDRHFVDEIHQNTEVDLGIFGKRHYDVLLLQFGRPHKIQRWRVRELVLQWKLFSRWRPCHLLSHSRYVIP